MDQGRLRRGYLFALAAFAFWGLFPVYFKAVAAAGPLEILAHRVIWSVPLCALMVTLAGGWGRMRQALAQPRVLLTLALTAVLVTGNWLTFIYAIVSGRILHASLGYYINPLVNVLLGMIFLGERLRPAQAAAVVLAAVGTLNLTLGLDAFPWISLVLAFSFGLYGLLRKQVAIESVEGLLVETSLTAPLALAYIIWLGVSGAGLFLEGGVRISLLLMAAGAVTTLPLVWFTAGARRIPLAHVGLLQYLAPSGQFCLAVFAYGETFTPQHAITFACIWTGLAIFAWDSWRAARSSSRAAKAAGRAQKREDAA